MEPLSSLSQICSAGSATWSRRTRHGLSTRLATSATCEGLEGSTWEATAETLQTRISTFCRHHKTVPLLIVLSPSPCFFLLLPPPPLELMLLLF